MDSAGIPFERFPALSACPGLFHAFTGRMPGLDVATDRELALERLAVSHGAVRSLIGCGNMPFVTATQVHGKRILEVPPQGEFSVRPECDGLITDRPGICLGIYVADCCAVYLADPVRQVIALLHSGKKGTEQNITGEGITMMVRQFGCEWGNITVQLSPCIRPPFYENDFATEIVRQAREAGAENVVDCGTCTAARHDDYYSYRVEKGQTGRMLALLALDSEKA